MPGCIQPMSSPMMKRMLGFCCAVAGGAAIATPTTTTTRTSQMLRAYLMSRFLLFASIHCTLLRVTSTGGSWHHLPPDARRHVSFASDGRTDGRHQLTAGVVLRDMRERAGRIAALCQLGILVSRDEDDPCVRLLCQEHRRGGDAVEAGHHDVGDDHVGTELFRRPDQGIAVD